MVFRKIVIEPCKELWRKYEVALDRRPLITKSILSGFLFFSGDVIAQGVERRFLDKPPKSPTWMGIEWDRAAQLTVFGVLLNGPALHWWYRFLDRRFGAGTGWKNVFKKVAADQFGFAPVFYVGFLGTMPLLQDTINYDTVRWLQGKPPMINKENSQNNNNNNNNPNIHTNDDEIRKDQKKHEKLILKFLLGISVLISYTFCSKPSLSSDEFDLLAKADLVVFEFLARDSNDRRRNVYQTA
eukprot:gb/GECH01008686.1/.p1 GENE.gb/GECH01008686.1/~~gb/GECH01008686.1/.p1  ORF type:complete len:241 (+),score=49.47 gb/GECH01008686.1/:1-723(+)